MLNRNPEINEQVGLGGVVHVQIFDMDGFMLEDCIVDDPEALSNHMLAAEIHDLLDRQYIDVTPPAGSRLRTQKWGGWFFITMLLCFVFWGGTFWFAWEVFKP